MTPQMGQKVIRNFKGIIFFTNYCAMFVCLFIDFPQTFVYFLCEQFNKFGKYFPGSVASPDLHRTFQRFQCLNPFSVWIFLAHCMSSAIASSSNSEMSLVICCQKVFGKSFCDSLSHAILHSPPGFPFIPQYSFVLIWKIPYSDMVGETLLTLLVVDPLTASARQTTEEEKGNLLKDHYMNFF